MRRVVILAGGVILILLLFWGCWLLWEPSGKIATTPAESPASGSVSVADPVQALGVTHGDPVDAGFIFVDGHYLDAPYIVSQIGLEVRINNDFVLIRWGGE